MHLGAQGGLTHGGGVTCVHCPQASQNKLKVDIWHSYWKNIVKINIIDVTNLFRASFSLQALITPLSFFPD